MVATILLTFLRINLPKFVIHDPKSMIINTCRMFKEVTTDNNLNRPPRSSNRWGTQRVENYWEGWTPGKLDPDYVENTDSEWTGYCLKQPAGLYNILAMATHLVILQTVLKAFLNVLCDTRKYIFYTTIMAWLHVK